MSLPVMPALGGLRQEDDKLELGQAMYQDFAFETKNKTKPLRVDSDHSARTTARGLEGAGQGAGVLAQRWYYCQQHPAGTQGLF